MESVVGLDIPSTSGEWRVWRESYHCDGNTEHAGDHDQCDGEFQTGEPISGQLFLFCVEPKYTRTHSFTPTRMYTYIIQHWIT